MGSFAIQDSFRFLNPQKLLRTEQILRFVYWAKIGTFIIFFCLAALVIQEFITSRLAVNAAIQDLENNVGPLRDIKPNILENGGEPKDISPIAAKSIFGPLGMPTIAPTAAIAQPGQSSAPINLVGVYLAIGEPPYAIIEDQKSKLSDIYEAKAKLPGGAILEAIFEDHIEILREGKREILPLKDPGAVGVDFKGGVAQLEEADFVVDEGELTRQLENLPTLLTEARAVPYFRDGKTIGLRLFAIKSGSFYERIGLRNGDVLKAINGGALSDLSQTLKLFEQLKAERNIDLMLERNNVEKKYKYQVR